MKNCVIFEDTVDDSCSSSFKLALEAYCAEKELKIISTFKLGTYSFDDDQNAYTKMIRFIKSNADIDNIIFISKHTLIADYNIFSNLIKLNNTDIHFLEESLVLNTTRNQKELLNLMAENFVRNLSERIKLNIEYYILHGHIPFKPLYGYVKKRIYSGSNEI